MSESLQTKMFHWNSPPKASNKSFTGGVIAITVAAVTPAVLDLSTVNKTNGGAANPFSGDDQPSGVIGQEITIEADGADVGVVFGPTLASVTAGNVPVLATVGAVNASGVYTDANGICYKIPNGQERRFLLQKEKDLFMGFVGGGAGTMRLYQSAPSGITKNT